MKELIYQALRDEIICNYEQENNLTQCVYATAVAAFGLAPTIKVCWLAFLVPIVIIPMSFRIADIRHSTAYIATYIKTCLENEDDLLGWENMHYKFSERNSNKGINRIVYNGSRTDFCILTLISNVLFWFVHGFSLIDSNIWKTVAIVVIQILILVFEGYLGFKYVNLKKMKDELIPLWKNTMIM